MFTFTISLFVGRKLGDGNNNNFTPKWTFKKHLENLDFADDIALLTHRHSDLDAKITTLDKQESDRTQDKPREDQDDEDKWKQPRQI